MTAGEIVVWPVTWLAVFIAFAGSLFACREWPMRVFFSLAMPVLYAFVWVICYLAIGAMVSMVNLDMPYDTFSLLTGALTTTVTVGCFVFQVVAMSRDSASRTYGYALGAGGRRSMRTESTRFDSSMRKKFLG